MSMLRRRKNGRFRSKSNTDRKVRSIRATDAAWESLGDIAESQNMTRADLMEHLLQNGKLDCIQGLDALQELAQQMALSAQEIEPIQQLTAQLNSVDDLEPLRELAQKLEPLQELAQTLEPIHELAQKLEPMQELVQKLEPLQELAQQLEPLQGASVLQALGKDVDVIHTAIKALERSQSADGQTGRQHRLAIALDVIQDFITAKSLSEKIAPPHPHENYQILADFITWIEHQRASIPEAPI